MLMGVATFIDGIASDVVVTRWGIAPIPANYMTDGAIQLPADVKGTLAGFIAGFSAENAQLAGLAAGVTDTLVADPALGGVIAPSFTGPETLNRFDVTLAYDGGAAPPGNGSVVRGVWKGVDFLIFVDISPVPPLFEFNGIDLTQFTETFDSGPNAGVIEAGAIVTNGVVASMKWWRGWVTGGVAGSGVGFTMDFSAMFETSLSAQWGIFLLAELGTDAGTLGTFRDGVYAGDGFLLMGGATSGQVRLYKYTAGVEALEDAQTLANGVDHPLRLEVTPLAPGWKFKLILDPDGVPTTIMDKDVTVALPPDLGDNVGLCVNAQTFSGSDRKASTGPLVINAIP